MDELRMIVSCIEYYSYAKNIPGNKVFEAFDKNGVIQLLQDTRNQFPEMDTSFYIGMIDGMMALERDAVEDTYGHYEERTELLIDVIGRIAKAHRMDAAEACRLYYGAKIAATVAEDSTGYYKNPQKKFLKRQKKNDKKMKREPFQGSFFHGVKTRRKI